MAMCSQWAQWYRNYMIKTMTNQPPNNPLDRMYSNEFRYQYMPISHCNKSLMMYAKSSKKEYESRQLKGSHRGIGNDRIARDELQSVGQLESIGRDSRRRGHW